MGLDEDRLSAVISAYENDEHGGVDLDPLSLSQLVLTRSLTIWALEGRIWAHPISSSSGMDYRSGVSFSSILELTNSKHAIRLPRGNGSRFLNFGFSGMVYPISAVDVRSDFKSLMT